MPNYAVAGRKGYRRIVIHNPKLPGGKKAWGLRGTKEEGDEFEARKLPRNSSRRSAGTPNRADILRALHEPLQAPRGDAPTEIELVHPKVHSGDAD